MTTKPPIVEGLLVQEVGRLPKRGKTTPRVEKAIELYRQLIAGEGDLALLPTLINHELARMEPAEQAAYYQGTTNAALSSKEQAR